ncbi:MAG: hypothetical protein JXO51_12135 [Candidatus Aminicenantes bacterium]|nr:hypothetical protein [Candidatus Aminicenantes bacterium]
MNDKSIPLAAIIALCALPLIGAGIEREIELRPFYRLQRRTYAVYLDLFTPAEWQIQKVTVRFQATNGNETARVLGVRLIRSEAGR